MTKKDRYCEICDIYLGKMDDDVWDSMDHMCDKCYEEHYDDVYYYNEEYVR